MIAPKAKGFYESSRRTLYALRVAGFLPVEGLRQTRGDRCRCSWRCAYGAYCALSAAGVLLGAALHLRRWVAAPPSHADIGGPGFLWEQCTAAVAVAFFLRLSWIWPDALDRIERVERSLPPFRNEKTIFRNVNRATACMGLFFLVEHVARVVRSVRVLELCLRRSGGRLSVAAYRRAYFAWWVRGVPDHFVVAYLQLVKLQTTFVFYYVDALLVAVTLHLVYRFRDFDRLMKVQLKRSAKRAPAAWARLQRHYTRLARLVAVVDDYVNPLLFLSFLSNLVSICKMIYDFIQHQKRLSRNADSADCEIAHSSDAASAAHRLLSAAALLGKALAVAALASALHALSREPLRALHALPPAAYDEQVQRFMQQVHGGRVALGGLRSFYVTRGAALAMVSTIITYELVLLQLPAARS